MRKKITVKLAMLATLILTLTRDRLLSATFGAPAHEAVLRGELASAFLERRVRVEVSNAQRLARPHL